MRLASPCRVTPRDAAHGLSNVTVVGPCGNLTHIHDLAPTLDCRAALSDSHVQEVSCAGHLGRPTDVRPGAPIPGVRRVSVCRVVTEREAMAASASFEEFYAVTVDRLLGHLFLVTAPRCVGRICATTTGPRPGYGE
jgi:hypothetical protein